MDSLKVSISKVFQGSIKSFSRFPGSIISAIVICIVAIIKINMDWETQKAYSLLFDSIQLSFVLGAVLSMAAVAYEELETTSKKTTSLFANTAGIIGGLISFILLYFFSGRLSQEGIMYLSTIASFRVGVAIFASSVAFVYIVSNAKTVDSFSDSFFITHKAFAISAIYGLVIMIGVSGVLGAFQALVYRQLGFRVYQYLAVAVGFLTYTVFLGYFPSFRSIAKTPKMKIAEEQPRFIFVLFGYILVPIIIALTLVLLIWSARVLLTGPDVSFNQLSSIASSYVIIGIWLHIMVAKHHTPLTNFYKIAYPFTGILVLAFEAWALIGQVNEFGLKTTEYSFIMIWIFALISLVLLIFLRDKAYRKIAIAAIVISIISALPFVGYQDITFNSQVSRLEKILNEEGLLQNNSIVKTKADIESLKRGKITDAVDFISYSEKTNTPIWFKENLNEDRVFKDTFGFDKTYGVYPQETEYASAYFVLKTELIDISDYPLALNINTNEKMNISNVFQGRDGKYEIVLVTKTNGIPKITVKLDDSIIIEKSLEEYLYNLQVKYPLDGNTNNELPFEDMSLLVEDENLSILLVFDNIDISSDKLHDTIDYYLNIHGLYLKYK